MRKLEKVGNFEEAVKFKDVDKLDGQFEKDNKKLVDKTKHGGY